MSISRNTLFMLLTFQQAPSKQMYFFNGPSRYIYYHQLGVIIALEIGYGTFYSAWNSPSVTFFTNKHDYLLDIRYLLLVMLISVSDSVAVHQCY